MTHQAIKNSSIVFFFGVIGALAGYGTRIYLSHSLTLDDFGLLYSALAIVGIVNIFKDLGTNAALVRFIPEFIVKKKNGKVKQAFYSSLLIQILIVGAATIVVFVFADAVSISVFGGAHAATLLKILILSALFSIIFVATQSTLQGMQKMKLYSFVEPFRLLFALGIMVLLIGFGVAGAALGYTIAAALTSVVFFVLLTKQFPEILGRNKISAAMTKSLLAFGFVFMAGSFATYNIQYADSIVLTFVRPLSDVGYYQAALSTSQMLWMFVTPLAAVLFPLVAELYASKKLNELSSTLRTFSTVAIFLILPLSIIIFSFPEIVLNIFFGPSFLPAAGALRILSVGAVFFSLFFMFQTTLLGIGKPGTNTRVVFYMALINIPANIIFAYFFGIEGAAVVSTLSYFLGAVLTYIYIRRYLNARIPVVKMTKIFMSGVITAAFIYLVKAPIHPHAYLEAVIVLVPAFIIYSALIIVTKGVERSDLEKLRDNGIPIPDIFYRVIR